MPWFVRGLAEVGARVYGMGELPEGALPDPVRRALSGYLQVRSLWDEEATVAEVHRLAREVAIDRVECL